MPEGFPALVDLSRTDPGLRDLILKKDSRARASPDSGTVGELALVYHANQFFEEARKGYDLAARLDPDNADWWYYRALLEEELGEAEAWTGSSQRRWRSAPITRARS